MERKAYPSDLSDAEWKLLEPLIPAPKAGGRPAIHSRREIVNAIRYVLRNGCGWRAIPDDFPPYTTVYDYFRTWRDSGVWGQPQSALGEKLRTSFGREAQPDGGTLERQNGNKP